MRRMLAVVMVLGAVMVGCSSSDEGEAPPMTGNDVGGGMALDGDVPDDAICRDLPDGCTPRPTADQAREIEAGVAAVYPGVPEGKATDWAIAVCADIRDDKDEATVLRNVSLRYAGGSRPDPTPAQAAQILEVIRAGGWCTP